LGCRPAFRLPTLRAWARPLLVLLAIKKASVNKTSVNNSRKKSCCPTLSVAAAVEHSTRLPPAVTSVSGAARCPTSQQRRARRPRTGRAKAIPLTKRATPSARLRVHGFTAIIADAARAATAPRRCEIRQAIAPTGTPTPAGATRSCATRHICCGACGPRKAGQL